MSGRGREERRKGQSDGVDGWVDGSTSDRDDGRAGRCAGWEMTSAKGAPMELGWAEGGCVGGRQESGSVGAARGATGTTRGASARSGTRKARCRSSALQSKSQHAARCAVCFDGGCQLALVSCESPSSQQPGQGALAIRNCGCVAKELARYVGYMAVTSVSHPLRWFNDRYIGYMTVTLVT